MGTDILSRDQSTNIPGSESYKEGANKYENKHEHKADKCIRLLLPACCDRYCLFKKCIMQLDHQDDVE